jgi:hypothetical protein
MIEKGRLYPLSCLRGVNHEARMRLVNSGMMLIKELLNQDPGALAVKTGLPREIVGEIMEKARQSANELWL